MPKPSQMRYSLQPLTRECGTRELGDRVGLSHQIIDIWARRGITWERADVLAIALGRHPGEVWPQWWDEALDRAAEPRQIDGMT